MKVLLKTILFMNLGVLALMGIYTLQYLLLLTTGIPVLVALFLLECIPVCILVYYRISSPGFIGNIVGIIATTSFLYIWYLLGSNNIAIEYVICIFIGVVLGIASCVYGIYSNYKKYDFKPENKYTKGIGQKNTEEDPSISQTKSAL